MMKKVLYGVALTLLASVSVGSLQSCKDDVNDLKTQTSYNLSELRDQLQKRIGELKTDLETLEGRVSNNEGDIDFLKGEVATIKRECATLNEVNRLLGELERDLKAQFGTDLANAVTDLKNQYKLDEIAGALSTISGLETRLTAVEEFMNNYTPGVTQESMENYVKGQIEGVQSQVTALDEYVKTLPTQADLEEVYLALEQTNEWLTQLLHLHEADMEEVQGQIEQIITAIDNIVDRLDKQVTGILIQGVNSPVFGDFRTPLGVKSNILFNWYGYNSFNKAITFPSADVVPAALAHETWSAPVGYYGDDAENKVTLGKVYVTLNPIGAKFDNVELSIENSAGVALPYTVTLNPSEEILYHGYTRADNGFYEGEVKLDLNDENVNQIKVTVEEGLKTSMKDALKDPSKTTAKALVKAVLEQLQGKIPAYGLRYGWYNGLADEDETDPGFAVGTYAAVLSQYDLAVATAHPLSYNFLAGYEGSRKLPEIGHIQNLIHKLQQDGDLELNLKHIVIKNAEIKIGKITITSKVDINGNNLVITLPKITVKDGDKELDVEYDRVITLTPEAELKSVYEAIEKGLTDALKNVQGDINDWTADMQKDLNKQLNDILKDVQTQVNDMIDSINGQIDDMLTNLGNKFQPYFDKVNKAIDIYNRIANKLNNFLQDPNAYLQVTALYNMGGANYGMVSGKLSDPTPFVQKGGDSFKIYLTSYTGELIVPACKKYVAVTGVYKNGKAVENADLAALNSGDLNKVLSGNQIEVLVKALPAGNVYEFTYQAIDYSGYTSTKKFYIEVK